MASRLTIRRAFFGRAVAVAFAVNAALYLVGFVRFQPLQTPADLLLVPSDVVEVAVLVRTLAYAGRKFSIARFTDVDCGRDDPGG